MCQLLWLKHFFNLLKQWGSIVPIHSPDGADYQPSHKCFHYIHSSYLDLSSKLIYFIPSNLQYDPLIFQIQTRSIKTYHLNYFALYNNLSEPTECHYHLQIKFRMDHQ